MARKKRSPSNKTWTQQITNNTEAGIHKCELCSRKPLPLLENQNYFIESDGNLTVRNGICTRRLVLSLFTKIGESPNKYQVMLGENFMKFILNLDQILKNQQQICPDESALQAITAQNVVMDHLGTTKLQASINPRKRTRDLMADSDKIMLKEGLQDVSLLSRNSEDVSSDMKLQNLPENFLTVPDDSDSCHSGDKDDDEPSDLGFHSVDGTDGNNNCGIQNNFSGSFVESGSVGSTSRPGSPSGSINSNIDSSKLANTKRGSKILPVASQDGATHYLCPVCNLDLEGDHELTVHIRSHNQTSQQQLPNSCTICGKVLSSQSSLDRHMLVHSGERPFKCKICGMSFTTNGNMHRHSRIHKKNGIDVPKPSGSGGVRRVVEAKPKKEGFCYDKMAGGSMGSTPSPSPYPTMVGDYSTKLDMLKNRSESDRTAEFLQQYYNDVNKLKALGSMGNLGNLGNIGNMAGMAGYMFPFNTPHHPAFPYHQLYSDPSNVMPYLPRMMDPVTGEILAKQARLSQQILAPQRPPSPDLRMATPVVCVVCKAEFATEFALESHMEEHVIVDKEMEAEAGNACKVCNVIAKSEESLLLHILTHHAPPKECNEEEMSSDEEDSKMEIDDTNSKKKENDNKKLNIKGAKAGKNDKIDKSKQGFHDLGFASFTTKKFPLIAKAFCESKVVSNDESLPVFKCKKCDKTFPVEGAKDLHEASHIPEEYTVCPKCDCHFSDSLRLQEHMQKHVSDMMFEKCLAKPETEEMPQNYFLVQLGLIAKDQPLEANHRNLSVKTDDNESVDLSIDEGSVISDDDRTDIKDEDIESVSSIGVQKIKVEEPSPPASKLRLTNFFLPKPSQRGSDAPTSYLAKQLSQSKSPKLSEPGFRSSPLTASAVTKLESPLVHRSAVFPCKHCDTILSSPSEFEVHQLRHKSPFECQVCNYSSTDRSTLQRHMRTHSGERPYKCVLCEYSFTTKANCERHLRQKHGLHKEHLGDYLAPNKHVISSLTPGASSRAPGDSRDNTPLSSKTRRQGFTCKKCKAVFTSSSLTLEHMIKHHPEVKSFMYESLIGHTDIPQASPLRAAEKASPTPPPAHSKPEPSSEKLAENKSWLKEISALAQGRDGIAKYFKLDTSLPTPSYQHDPDQPLDFSKPSKSTSLTPKTPSMSASPSLTPSMDTSDDQPIDLSVPSKKSYNTQPKNDFLTKTIKKEPYSGASKTLDLSSPPSRSTDPNNNQLSPLHAMLQAGKTGFSLVSTDDSSNLATSPLKHPAFPQYVPMGSAYQGLVSAGLPPQSLASPRPLTIGHQLALMAQLQPTLGAQLGAALAQGKPLNFTQAGSSSAKVNDSPKTSILSSVLKAEKTHDEKARDKSRAKMSLMDSKPKADLSNSKPDIVDLKRKKTKPSNGSSCESDSSCELASLNKILDATNPQNFQNYLMIPGDDQDSKSESVQSGDESNQSLENMFTQSQSLGPGSLASQLATLDSEADKTPNGNPDSPKGSHSVTVNMALMEAGLPEGVAEKALATIGQKHSLEDPSNMSEAAIVELIEKVARENINSPAKKKRNSYADSPHKFTCPYCPRCFPWLSSLNRHLLTHTGQKPFKCPRCPVTFSTKSNRERHLIRKHNVNMLDPASRATMDRPYKCHLCVFSSFSTQSNLVKHYKDRHNGASPPAHLLEVAEKSGSDEEGEDSNGNPSYEDEEEYNLSEMQNGLSDKEIMLHQYTVDTDNAPSAQTVRDPHKKRNAIFNFVPEEVNNGSSSSSPSPSSKTECTSRPGIDDTVLTDTMKQFLDKSVRQALEDSHRRAMEEGSAFIITPAIEKHLRHLSPGDKHVIEETIKQWKADMDPATRGKVVVKTDMDPTTHSKVAVKPDMDQAISGKMPVKPVKDVTSKDTPIQSSSTIASSTTTTTTNTTTPTNNNFNVNSGSDFPFRCYLCDSAFALRAECLQHQSDQHSTEWATLKEKNDVVNIQIFALRLDKLIDKLCKKAKEVEARQAKENAKEDEQAKEETGDKDKDTETEIKAPSPVGIVTRSRDSSKGKRQQTEEIDNIKATNQVVSENKDEKAEKADKVEKTTKADPGFINEVLATDFLQRKVHCSLCLKRFWALQDLRRHMRSHTGEQPFACNVCPKRFTLKHSLNRHKAKHHSKEVTGIPDAASEDDASGEDSPDAKTKKASEAEDAEEKDDMLHNLLGVDTSTIDQIFDAKDTAASLLGVRDGKPAA